MFARETLSLHSIAPDLIPQDAPAAAWNSGHNVLFKNGESVRTGGDAPTLPGATVSALTCVYLTIGTSGFWAYATNDGIYVHDGTIEFDITPPSWAGVTDNVTFTSCVLGGIAYFNASDRDPVYWPGQVDQVCEVLPDWPSGGRTLALRAHKNFLFAIGMVSEGGQRLRWSDAAELGEVPQFWAPASDNFAGFLDLAPMSSPCLEGVTLRDSFLVFKNESVWSLDFVGGNAVFQARTLFAEHGIVNTNAATRGIDDVVLFVGADGDVYLTDGVKVQSVLDGRAQRTFYQDFTQNKWGLFCASTLAREKAGIIAFPTSGAAFCNRALVLDFATMDIGFRDMPDALCMSPGGRLIDVGESNIWDGDPQAWDEDATIWPQEVPTLTLDDVIVGGAFGFVVISAGANAFVDGEVTATLSKAGLAFGNPQSRKMIGRIWPKIAGENGDTLSFRLGGQEVTGGVISLQPPVTFTIGQDQSIDSFVQGRFLNIEITSVGGAPWRLGTIDVEYREVGGW